MNSEQWASLRRLLDEALDDAAGRPRLLAQLRLGDPETCDELERLLGELDGEGEPFHDPGPAIPEWEGRNIGPYTILGEIGRGGTGVVFRAVRQEADTRIEVALKILGKDFLSGAQRRMFQRELRMLTRLDHPNIARLIDWGTIPGGLLYLVIEFVDGLNLTTYCAQNHLGLAERLAVFQQICAAVEHAHRNLVVHRDLKPSNILVAEGTRIKLLDFGIATELDYSGDPTTLMQRWLTPAYASPEQLEGKPVSVATDVYSLGVVLYELLTGCLPHSKSPNKTPRAGRRDDFVAPSGKVGLANIASREIAGDLDSIVLKAIRIAPEERYPSVGQFSADIQRHIQGRPVLARRPSPLYVAGRFLRRNRLQVAAAALAILALMATAAIAVWKWRDANRNLEEAQRDYRELRAFAQAVISNVDAKTVASPTEAERRMSETVARYLAQLSANRQNDEELQLQIAAAYLQLGSAEGADTFPNQGNTDAALANFQNGYRISLDRWRVSASRNSGVRLLQACQDIAPLLPDPAPAAAFLSEGLDATLGLLSRYPKDTEVLKTFANAFGVRAQRVRSAGDLSGAMSDFRRAIEFAKAVLALDPSNSEAMTLQEGYTGELGTTLRMTGRLEEALTIQMAAREMAVRAFRMRPANHTRRQAAFKLLSRCETLRDLKRYPEALRDAQAALAELRAIASQDNANEQAKADLSLAFVRMGDIAFSEGRIQDALANHRQAMYLRQNLFHRHSSNIQAALNYQAAVTRCAEVLLEGQQVGAARDLFTSAIDVGERLHSQTPSNVYAIADLARAYSGEALCARRVGNGATARALLSKSVKLWNEIRIACPLDVELSELARRTEQLLE